MIKLREDVAAWSPVGDESVVLDLTESTYLTLNDTATLLWSLASRGTDEEAMVAALLGEYEVDESTARSSVRAFVEDLERRGYLSESR